MRLGTNLSRLRRFESIKSHIYIYICHIQPLSPLLIVHSHFLSSLTQSSDSTSDSEAFTPPLRHHPEASRSIVRPAAWHERSPGSRQRGSPGVRARVAIHRPEGHLQAIQQGKRLWHAGFGMLLGLHSESSVNNQIQLGCKAGCVGSLHG